MIVIIAKLVLIVVNYSFTNICIINISYNKA